jgi:GR25 family glycosyltransferase involved in LPS biosynthesis
MKYTILHVGNRAKDLIDQNKKILSSFEYVDSIKFFNGNTNDPWHELSSRGIDVSSWKPYCGRTLGPLPGELGIWISYLNIFEYIIKTNTEQLLVIEDDAIIEDGAGLELYSLIKELPKNWDFLSLYYRDGQNQITPESKIMSDKIHKSINQLSSTVAIVYSYSFAKKFLKLVNEKGIENTVDDFLYRQAALGLLNGYSIIPNTTKMVSHDSNRHKSLIDPDDLRIKARLAQQAKTEDS